MTILFFFFSSFNFLLIGICKAYIVSALENVSDDFEGFCLQRNLILLRDDESGEFIGKISNVNNFFFDNWDRVSLLTLVLSLSWLIAFSAGFETL